MKQTRALLIFGSLILLLMVSVPAYAQLPWSGIISPSRAVDWRSAGIGGGIPNRTTICSTLNPGVTTSQINSAIASCPSGGVVFLNAGTYNLSSGITFGSTSNVTVRGQGANSTFIIFSGGGNCNGISAAVCMAGSNSAAGFEQNVCNWTAGYSQGSTVLTLANCGSATPNSGSIANLHVGSILVVDQVDETSDTGTIWNCLTTSICSNTGNGGFARANGPCVSGTCTRSQEQGMVVTSISGSQVTVTPGLYMPNWRSTQLPQAWFASSVVSLDGIENLSMDLTSAGQEGVLMMNCNSCWEQGVRSMVAGRSHVMLLGSVHAVLQSNYYYQSQSHLSVSYAIEEDNSFDNVVQNNISQQVTDSLPNNNGGAEGNVNAYNFGIDNVFGSTGWMEASFYQHSSGDAFNLWEGNISPGYTSDDIHGTHHFETLFRNYLIGNQAAGCGSAGLNTCTAQTIPIHIYAGSRYANIIGNVLGQSGYHNNYQCAASSGSQSCSGNTSIYVMGYTGNGGGQDSSVNQYCTSPACSSVSSYDPQVPTYVMRWGNYDTVNAAVRFVSSEVPSGIALYANPVPGSTSLPASFYLSSKPTWFGSVPFPAAGPDVTGGSVSGLNGHVYMNPAMSCYINTMGGSPTGVGSVLAFDASVCYGSHVGPAPPTNLSIIVQ